MLGSEYLNLEDERDIQNLIEGTVVTYLGEEWITRRLADLNTYDDLWIGWGDTFNYSSGLCTINVNEDDKTFTRTTGSFIDDGFAPGQDVTFSGFVVEGNNTTKVADTVTDDTIVVLTNFGMRDELGSGNEQANAFISKRDTQLFNEIDTRNRCVLEYGDGSGDDARYRTSGILTATGERIIKEIGIFDAETDGNLLAHVVIPDYELNDGDSVTFTLALNPE
jgi:hypothetical protein